MIIGKEDNDMEFHSISYLLFFPFVALLYFLIPTKYRKYFLLFASYYFYMSWNIQYGFLMLFETILTYFCAYKIEKDKKETQKFYLWLGIGSPLFILFIFKYLGFFFENISFLFQLFDFPITISVVDFVLPVGISFFTFQAIGYLMDVYRKETKTEKDIFSYALFISFFPQLVAGPIERSKNLLRQIHEKQSFTVENFQIGLLKILAGYFMKLMIADRCAIAVNEVFQNAHLYGWGYVVVATILFSFQIYCDFAGYSLIAIGSARIIGFRLTENFNAPYLARSIQDFWNRWHITLSHWLRDYVYIPLGGSRVSKLKKYRNILVVFTLSGLWHGANWGFVIWGVLHGCYRIISDITKKMREKVKISFHLKENSRLLIWIQRLFTFILVSFSFFFFRTENITKMYEIVEFSFHYQPWSKLSKTEYLGLSPINWGILAISLIFLLGMSLFRQKRSIYQIYEKHSFFIRLLFVALFVIGLLIFGIYGPAFHASEFIYFRF